MISPVWVLAEARRQSGDIEGQRIAVDIGELSTERQHIAALIEACLWWQCQVRRVVEPGDGKLSGSRWRRRHCHRRSCSSPMSSR